MASARLRKAFRYPDDSGDDEHGREELDEEEQERVIDRLKVLNEKRNSEYSIVFAAAPLFAGYAFVASILSGSSGPYERFLSLLSILSLLATAYTMRFLPLQRPDPKGKRPMTRSTITVTFQRYTLPLNASICVLLALIYASQSTMGLRLGIEPITYLVPGAMFTTVLVARKVMLSVDLKALENLRYEYKGA
ncbi:uncharacterized protein BO80DRAFT_78232 [Aspergillus ibericus CBS 121593]|uniref:Uncharacterized protein n=1 Tax=Aspergillus ibericus CBS 121593 TaxID=1448316 RepID=A0A395HCK5_9EURO|nr:hypothetical protein BO80DRAFT_78232 [Aspergillus ibericus CBS 121593]RAL05691.1 hypothetical protein BO80DRAFT_78232 [Aspergillus ibericus CBS 121593]